MLHRQWLDRIAYGNGQVSIDRAPLVAGVRSELREIRSGQIVALDPRGAIEIVDDLGWGARDPDRERKPYDLRHF